VCCAAIIMIAVIRLRQQQAISRGLVAVLSMEVISKQYCSIGM
jgi:hypothetical protein